MKDETQEIARHVLLTGMGRKFLAFLLADMGFFDTNLKTPEEVAVRNYANKILGMCGIFPTKKYNPELDDYQMQEIRENVIDNLANVVIPPTETGPETVVDIRD